jgi:hypothetical protein
MEHLFGLEKAVETVETRVPFGRPAMRLLLSLMVIYLLFEVSRAIFLECLWPGLKLAVELTSSLRTGHFLMPRFSVDVLVGSVLVGTAAASLVYVANRIQRGIYSKIRALELAIDKYQSIFWKPLGPREKAELVAHLAKLGTYSVRVGAHQNTDCIELAHDIKECFEKADWNIVAAPLTRTYDTVGASGFMVSSCLSSDIRRELVESLSAVVGPVLGVQGDASDRRLGDVSVIIGPRRLRNG